MHKDYTGEYNSHAFGYSKPSRRALELDLPQSRRQSGEVYFLTAIGESRPVHYKADYRSPSCYAERNRNRALRNAGGSLIARSVALTLCEQTLNVFVCKLGAKMWLVASPFPKFG